MLRSALRSIRGALSPATVLALVGTLAGFAAGWMVWPPIGLAVFSVLTLYVARSLAAAELAAELAETTP